MIYHVLPEIEPFSEQTGGALSRWVANIIRDDTDSRVVCPQADDSWGFPTWRLVQMPEFAIYALLRKAAMRVGGRFWRLVHAALPAALARLATVIRAGDIVYIHNRPEYVPYLRQLCPRPVTIVLHLANSHLANVPYGVAVRANADLTVFCSRYIEEEAQTRLPQLGRSVVIPNGADKSLFFPSEASEADLPAILFVGRLVPDKGAHIFVDAIKLLNERGIRVIGRIVGSPTIGRDKASDYTKELRRQSPPNIEFLPYCSGTALAAEFRRATIFCCPSVWEEPFGMVNVEAMASRLPVVATSVGGVPDIFSSGGALLVPKNDAAATADALSVLATDLSMRKKVAADGYAAFLARFEWSVIRKRYREAMSGLLEAEIMRIA